MDMATPRNTHPKMLLLDTSCKAGVVGICHGDEPPDSIVLAETRRHGRDLAPAVVQLCNARGWRPRDLEAVVVGRGPGSYTGLRVGLMSAKTLAYATGCTLLVLDSFAVIAAQTPPRFEVVDVLADAQQRLVYVQRFDRVGEVWEAATGLAIQPLAAWLAGRDPGVAASGPGVSLAASTFPNPDLLVEAECREPRVATLQRLGLARWHRGAEDDPWTLEPLYLRPSNAEENWRKRNPAPGS